MMVPAAWASLCERAQCSPDFDVVYGFDRARACEWLGCRLADRCGVVVPLAEIEAAYDAWPPKGSGS